MNLVVYHLTDQVNSSFSEKNIKFRINQVVNGEPILQPVIIPRPDLSSVASVVFHIDETGYKNIIAINWKILKTTDFYKSKSLIWKFKLFRNLKRIKK